MIKERLMPDLSNTTDALGKTMITIRDNFGIKSKNVLEDFNKLYPINTVDIEETKTIKIGNNDILTMTVRITVPGLSKIGIGSIEMNMYNRSKNAYRDLYMDAYKHAIEQFGIIGPKEDDVKEDDVNSDNKENPVSQPVQTGSNIHQQPGIQSPVVEQSINQPTGAPNIPQENYQGTPNGNPVQQAPAQVQPQQQVAPAQTPTQPSANNGSQFTEEQVKAVTQFKQDKKIPNNEILLTYIKAWNPNIQAISQLSSQELDKFLEWTRTGSLNL